jgi:hypothetical protein
MVSRYQYMLWMLRFVSTPMEMSVPGKWTLHWKQPGSFSRTAPMRTLGTRMHAFFYIGLRKQETFILFISSSPKVQIQIARIATTGLHYTGHRKTDALQLPGYSFSTTQMRILWTGTTGHRYIGQRMKAI